MKFLGTFGFWRRKKPELLEEPKGILLENFSASSEDFYAAIEAELAALHVADLTISRELFAEDGLLSSRREYLRMRRERYVFDICAAPFGTSYFFSTRFAEIPVVLYVWQLAGELWKDVTGDAAEDDPTLVTLIEARLAEYQAHPERVAPWADVKARLLALCR